MFSAIPEHLRSISTNRRMTRMEQEIYEKIFPHVRGEKNFEYPFSNVDELRKTLLLDGDYLPERIKSLEILAQEMPTAYARAFRHVMYRELFSQLDDYEALMRRRLKKQCDPRRVATKA